MPGCRGAPHRRQADAPSRVLPRSPYRSHARGGRPTRGRSAHLHHAAATLANERLDSRLFAAVPERADEATILDSMDESQATDAITVEPDEVLGEAVPRCGDLHHESHILRAVEHVDKRVFRLAFRRHRIDGALAGHVIDPDGGAVIGTQDTSE